MGEQSEVCQAWRRLRDFGLKLQAERNQVLGDSARLSQRFHKAADNFARASTYLTDLAEVRRRAEPVAAAEGLSARRAQIELAEIDRLTQEHLGKRELFLQATGRIYRILRKNDAYLELLEELSDQTSATLACTLRILRCQAQGQEIPRYLLGEFRQATGRLSHPARLYQKIYEQRG